MEEAKAIMQSILYEAETEVEENGFAVMMFKKKDIAAMQAAVDSMQIKDSRLEAKKVVESKSQYDMSLCPNCSMVFDGMDYGTNYCPNCGQELKWEDGDEGND